MSGELGDWSLLRRAMTRAQCAVDRAQIRRDLEDHPEETEPSITPNFALFIDIINFFYHYRKIELGMARLYPNETKRHNLEIELDGQYRRENLDGNQ